MLKIVRSLDRDIERTEDGLRGAVTLMASTTVLLLMLCVSLLVGTRARGRRKATRT